MKERSGGVILRDVGVWGKRVEVGEHSRQHVGLVVEREARRRRRRGELREVERVGGRLVRGGARLRRPALPQHGLARARVGVRPRGGRAGVRGRRRLDAGVPIRHWTDNCFSLRSNW